MAPALVAGALYEGGAISAWAWGALGFGTGVAAGVVGAELVDKARKEDDARYVYRGLHAGENPAVGLFAHAPGAGHDPINHVAGKKETQWISTTKDLNIALEKYGQEGVVRIDLNKVNT